MAAYPRKQTVAIFLICMMAVLGVSYYVNGSFIPTFSKPVAVDTKKSSSATINPVVTAVLPGNSDWKKQFTGADSVSDSFKPVKSVAVQKAPAEKLTATDKLGRYFFTNYAQLSQAGLSDDASSVDALMSAAASQSVNIIPPPKIYTVKAFKTVSDSASAINNYHSIVELTAKDYVTRVDDVSIAVNAFESEDTKQLVKIDSTIATYNTMISRLLSAQVPQSLAQGHLNLLNGISVLLYSARAFRDMDVDPFQGLAAVKTEAEGLQFTERAFSEISSFFTIGKI